MSLAERYTILEKLGEGGMAEVYRAQHLLLEREVAIKFIHSSIQDDPEFDHRFKREAQAIARLTHPNIIHVYDFDRDETRGYFMVMELLQGNDLSHLLRRLRKREEYMPLPEVLRITRAVAEALGYAHAQGVIHRDIKPSNIFLSESGRVVVTDFGIAKLSNKSVITTADILVGTPHYLAPEVANGLIPDHRVDIYATGAMFFQLLTNRYPYDSENVLEVIAQHLNAPVPDPRAIQEDLPPRTTEIVRKALAKNPDERYPDFGAMLADLDALALEIGMELPTPKSYTPTPSANPTPYMLSQSGILSKSEVINPPTPSAVNLPVEKKSRPLWQWAAGLVVLIAVALGGFYSLIQESPDDDNTLPTATTPPLNIQTAQEGEYLYVVANVTNDQHPQVNVPRQLLNALQDGSLQNLLGGRFRAEYVNRTIHNTAEADALAEETGALMVVWGEEDATGLEVVLYIPRYSAKSLRELRFRVPASNEAEFTEIVANDLKQFVPYIAEFMTNQQLLHDNIFLSSIDFGRITQPKWGDVTGLRIVPATTLEREMLVFMQNMVDRDYEALDASLTAILKITPEESSLYFLRFAINSFLLNRLELARADIEPLQTLLPDNPLALWCSSMLYVFADDYQGLYDMTQTGIDDPLTVNGQLALFYHTLSAIMLGKYDEAEANALQMDADASNHLFNFPTRENLLAILYTIQGNPDAAQPFIEAVRSDRRITEVATNLTNAPLPNPPAGLVLWFGFALEMNGETTTAEGAYLLLMSDDVAPYLGYWRRGAMAEAAEDFSRARNFYQSSVDNASLPFPIASYQLALLLQKHPELDPASGQVCTLLETATQDANTQREFYAVLLAKISTLQSEAGCQ